MSRTLDLEITALAFGGDGVARDGGRVVFVPFTVPGDRVRVRITREEKNLLRGEVEEVLQPGPGRVSAPCPHFGHCGGCQTQHMDYETEVVWKERQVRETLERIGRIQDPPVAPLLRSPEPYHYRNRITVHLRDGAVGFLSRDGRELVDVEHCLLAEEEVNEALWRLRRRPPAGRERWTLRASGVEGHAFYQTNRFLLEALRARVMEAVDARVPALVEGYCGVGFFTEVLAPKFQRTAAIELTPRAAAMAEAKRLPGTTVFQGRCEDWWSQAWNTVRGEEGAVALVDPPREGLSAALVGELRRLPFHQLVYLSCNPATLARDLARLAPRWKLERVEPVDLFPRTAHIECLAVLRPLELN
jgi:23S rRNA (uracil1939-C5)-methyltransferase